MANELQYTSVFQRVSFGDYGLRVLSSGETSVANEAFAAIQVLTDCVVSFTNNTGGGRRKYYRFIVICWPSYIWKF